MFLDPHFRGLMKQHTQKSDKKSKIIFLGLPFTGNSIFHP
jgi:hypothetical protein